MSKEKNVQEKLLATTISLRDLLSISALGYEGETEENKGRLQMSLQVFAKDLIPDKVDAIGFFVEKEDFAIKAEEQWIKDQKEILEKRKNAFEKIKKYFAETLDANNFTAEHRLNGTIMGIYSNYTYKKNDKLDINVIPDNYKKKLVVVTITEDIFKDLFENVDNPPPMVKYERQTVIDYASLKEDLEKDCTPENEESIMQPFYVKNVHLKIGKSNKKGVTVSQLKESKEDKNDNSTTDN